MLFLSLKSLIKIYLILSPVRKVDSIIIIYKYIMSPSCARFECRSYGPKPNNFLHQISISKAAVCSACSQRNTRFMPTNLQELQEASQLCWLWSRRIIQETRLHLVPYVCRDCPLPVFSTGLKESSESCTFCWLFPSGNKHPGLPSELWVWTVTLLQHVTFSFKLVYPHGSGKTGHQALDLLTPTVSSCTTSPFLC